MPFDVIVTVGPATLDPEILSEIDGTEACIYRLNGAHLNAAELPKQVAFVRRCIPEARVLLDLPGRKIRSRGLVEPLHLEVGDTVEVGPEDVNFSDFHKYVTLGDHILASDSLVTLEVEAIVDGVVTLRSLSSGVLLNHKGLHIPTERQTVPALLQDDLELIEAAGRIPGGVDYLGLSYVHDASDVEQLKVQASKVGVAAQLMAKIETRSALEHLDEILGAADSLLIDRGDLSAEIGLLDLPVSQAAVLETAKAAGVPVFLATQFLTSMLTRPVPLLAELMDLHRTIADGAAGIQLSEETAVGEYPLVCVQTIAALVERIRGAKYERAP